VGHFYFRKFHCCCLELGCGYKRALVLKSGLLHQVAHGFSWQCNVVGFKSL
jgi:hypothetical protein